jgi:colicin import membrane protein
MQRPRDRWVSIALSVLLHGALLAALVYGWLLYRRPPRPAPTLAIEATVVDARTARGALQPQPAPPAAAPQPETAPPEPPPESVGPPQPTPEELAQREQERQQAEAAAAQKAAEELAAKQAAEQAEKQAEEQRQAEAKAAAERQAKEAEAQKRAAEERQRQADEQDQSEREADLKRSLAEEQASTARAGPAREAWLAQIQAKIQHAWIRPPTARTGIECVLDVTQVPGGEVTEVSVGQCNGDQAVRESIEDAVYRASPLPAPPDPAEFDRRLRIIFKPDSD